MDEWVEVKDKAQRFGLENWGNGTERENSEKGAGLGSGLSSVLKLLCLKYLWDRNASFRKSPLGAV